MNLWQQNYDPAGNIWLSSLIASLPILFFFFQFSIFIGGFHQRQLGLLVADGVETIAQTLDFILFDFFHGGLIC